MKVIWTSKAEQNLAEIFDYIAADNPHAAVRMNIRFRAGAARLADYPYMGKSGPLPDTRELFPHKHYRMVYEVDEATDTIYILSLIHGARQVGLTLTTPPRRRSFCATAPTNPIL